MNCPNCNACIDPDFDAYCWSCRKVTPMPQTLPPEVSSFGLTQQQALWLAFRIGESLYTSGLVTSGRDIMMVIHARWHQMGFPLETLPEFERAILKGEHPFCLSTTQVIQRAPSPWRAESPSMRRFVQPFEPPKNDDQTTRT